MSQTLILENICSESFIESGGQVKYPDLKHLGLIKDGCALDERQKNDPKTKDLLLKTTLSIHAQKQFPDATRIQDFSSVEIVPDDMGVNYHVYGNAYGPRG